MHVLKAWLAPCRLYWCVNRDILCACAVNVFAKINMHVQLLYTAIIFIRYNLIQGWMESRETASDLKRCDDNTYNQKMKRLPKLNNEKQ